MTPQGHLRVISDAESPPLSPELAKRLTAAFERGAGHGLLHLGARIDDAGLPLNKYLVEIAIPDATWAVREQRYVAALPVHRTRGSSRADRFEASANGFDHCASASQVSVRRSISRFAQRSVDIDVKTSPGSRAALGVPAEYRERLRSMSNPTA